MSRSRALVFVLCSSVLAGGCERESRKFEPPPNGGTRIGAQADVPGMIAKYDKNAYAVATGKRLFTWYNCNGCHANGGGGSGPALMDDVWIYGSAPMAVYQTIVEGRPNGMPAFRGRIPEDQIWQLVSYVRSMSGLASPDAAPNRDDAMIAKPPEVLADRPRAVTATPSPASRQP